MPDITPAPQHRALPDLERFAPVLRIQARVRCQLSTTPHELEALHARRRRHRPSLASGPL